MAVMAAEFIQSPPNRRIPSQRPPPARRRIPLTLVLLVALFTILSPTSAFERPRFAVRRIVDEQWENDIVFDPRPVPEIALHKRQFDVGSTTTKTHSSTKTASSQTSSSSSAGYTPASTNTAEATNTGGIITAPTSTSSTIPKAFDGGLGTNYTQTGCLTFLRKMLNDDSFVKCVPVSVLLQNSQAFFSASRSAKSLDPVLAASCNIPSPSGCSALVSSYAGAIRSTSNCGADFDRQQPMVRQAYNGLVAYDVVVRSVCTKSTPSAANNNTADYCYTNAVTNTSSPTDAYVYYLPLGVALPPGSMPTCSECLKQTMGLFGSASKNKTQPISNTYYSAAQQINLNCGPNFVNQSFSDTGSGNAGETIRPPMGVTVVLGGVVAIMGAVGLL